jgi:hypothetical protein
VFGATLDTLAQGTMKVPRDLTASDPRQPLRNEITVALIRDHSYQSWLFC